MVVWSLLCVCGDSMLKLKTVSNIFKSHLFTSILRSFSFLNGTPPTDIRGAMGGIFLDPHLDGRLLDDPMPVDPSSLSVLCQTMQVKL